MAEFTVAFDTGELPGPDYESFMVGQNSICGDDARTHPIKFNDSITGDYVVGYNWENPVYGLPPGSIKIESFTDITEVVNIVAGTVIPNPYASNTLRDNSTGLTLTYPYTTPTSNLHNIVENFSQLEIECYEDNSDKYMNTRTRSITYRLYDTAGHVGPLATATYRNYAP